MRSTFLSALLGTTLLVSASLPAITAQAQGNRLATVDMMRAFSEVDEGRQGLKELERFKAEKQTVLDKKQNDLNAAKEDLDRQGMMIKPEVKQQKLEDLQRKMMQIYANMQQELSKKEMEFKVGVSRKLQVIIAEIAERENYDMVLDSTQGGPVVYSRSGNDITSEVIRAYNKRFAKKGKSSGKGKSKSKKKAGH